MTASTSTWPFALRRGRTHWTSSGAGWPPNEAATPVRARRVQRRCRGPVRGRWKLPHLPPLDVRKKRELKETPMNHDTLEGQWTQLKGRAREQWGKLTDDDLDQVRGKAEQLAGKVQERYGVAKDEASRQVDTWLRDLDKTPSSTGR
jgi:uncharacterized protein YjbJ (UPF0337 family)